MLTLSVAYSKWAAVTLSIDSYKNKDYAPHYPYNKILFYTATSMFFVSIGGSLFSILPNFELYYIYITIGSIVSICIILYPYYKSKRNFGYQKSMAFKDSKQKIW